ncbi:MAG: hypothetical protein CMJ32_02115 [Phycisphaerae bacterium]|nr:hypothetical protein [Phycisphaerae bacterium]
MYQALLANRYLTSRIIPLIAVAAVALCVALVIIVVSVMTGFLDMLKSSGKTLMGDVIVGYPVRGIPHYERLIDEINGLSTAAVASPLIDSYGLLRMPYPEGDDKEVVTVQVWGIQPESFAGVTGMADSIYWKELSEQEAATARDDDFRRRIKPGMLGDSLTLTDPVTGRRGALMGIHVSIVNDRQQDGSYEPKFDHWWLPGGHEVTLTLVPISSKGSISEPRDRTFPIINEFHTGVYQIDKSRIMIPLEDAQHLLRLEEAIKYDTSGELDENGRPPVIGTSPARATKILVRAADGVTPDELLADVRMAYERFWMKVAAEDGVMEVPPSRELVTMLTWEQQLRDLIGPVEKERELMRILFSIIYLVCAGLVLSIFWAIVYEKTRDIGILRSVGASRLGILWIFLRYGMVIGILGSILGVGLAYLVVSNINEIHDAIGQDAPTWSWVAMYSFGLAAAIGMLVSITRSRVLYAIILGLVAISLGGVAFALQQHVGTVIWDPAVYYFSTLPSQLDFFTVIITMIGAIVFSILGAAVPAAKAADTDPVKALRYE